MVLETQTSMAICNILLSIRLLLPVSKCFLVSVLFFLRIKTRDPLFASFKTTVMKRIREIFIGSGRRNISSSVINQLELR